jgi:hypothetical protein
MHVVITLVVYIGAYKFIEAYLFLFYADTSYCSSVLLCVSFLNEHLQNIFSNFLQMSANQSDCIVFTIHIIMHQVRGTMNGRSLFDLLMQCFKEELRMKHVPKHSYYHMF